MLLEKCKDKKGVKENLHQKDIYKKSLLKKFSFFQSLHILVKFFIFLQSFMSVESNKIFCLISTTITHFNVQCFSSLRGHSSFLGAFLTCDIFTFKFGLVQVWIVKLLSKKASFRTKILLESKTFFYTSKCIKIKN